jgi:hypothetical protein
MNAAKVLFGTAGKVILTIIIVILMIICGSAGTGMGVVTMIFLWIIMALPSILAIPAAREHMVVTRKSLKAVRAILEEEFLPQDRKKRKWSKHDGVGMLNYQLDLFAYPGPVVSVDYEVTPDGVAVSIMMTEFVSGGGTMPMFWSYDPWWIHGASRAGSKIKSVITKLEPVPAASPSIGTISAPDQESFHEDETVAAHIGTPVPLAPAIATVSCPACGQDNQITNKFCKSCEHPFTAQDIDVSEILQKYGADGALPEAQISCAFHEEFDFPRLWDFFMDSVFAKIIDADINLISEEDNFIFHNKEFDFDYSLITSGGIIGHGTIVSDDERMETLREYDDGLSGVWQFLFCGIPTNSTVNKKTLMRAANGLKAYLEENGFHDVFFSVITLVDGAYVEVPWKDIKATKPQAAPIHSPANEIVVPAPEPKEEIIPASNSAESLSGAMASFTKLLRENGVKYSVNGAGAAAIVYAYRDESHLPFIEIETTQLFNNAGCAMTYLQKDWRQNPFAEGDLGSIGISISEPFEICVSAALPGEAILDENVQRQTIQQIESLLDNGEFFKGGILCSSYFNTPYIMLTVGFDNPNMQTSDNAFGFLQLFAKEVHRIFGSITTPSGAPAPPPKSNVVYTPDVTDANGGYFVYGKDGFAWWLIDQNLRFKSIVGEGVWQEQKDAEADGLPLTAVDYDNLYRYEGGVVYNRDGELVGRYYPERYDIKEQWASAESLFNTFQSEKMLNGFRAMCDLYFLFPDNEPLFGEISDIVEQARGIGSSSSADSQIFAKACLTWLDKFKQKCPADDKIRRL